MLVDKVCVGAMAGLAMLAYGEVMSRGAAKEEPVTEEMVEMEALAGPEVLADRAVPVAR